MAHHHVTAHKPTLMCLFWDKQFPGGKMSPKMRDPWFRCICGISFLKIYFQQHAKYLSLWTRSDRSPGRVLSQNIGTVGQLLQKLQVHERSELKLASTILALWKGDPELWEIVRKWTQLPNSHALGNFAISKINNFQVENFIKLDLLMRRVHLLSNCKLFRSSHVPPSRDSP